MIFSSPSTRVGKLQKQLDAETCVSVPSEKSDELWIADDGHGDFSSCQCTAGSAPSVRLQFPDPIPRGGEA